MIEYRKSTCDDIDELIRLRIEFLKEAQDIKSNMNTSVLKKSLLNYFINTMDNNQFIAWLALDKNKIVATSGLCFYTLPPSYENVSGNIAYVMNMYTEPDYRNKGIATYLFEKMIDEAKYMGYKKLCLHATEIGKSLYVKYGFEDTNTEMILNINRKEMDWYGI